MNETNTKKYSVSSIFEVRENTQTNFKSMFAAQDLKANSILANFNGALHQKPTRYTVQVSTNQHIKLNPEYLQYINHSCQPNVFFDTTKRQLMTLRSIAEGEELSFFYPSTEWQMTEAFDCICGSTDCLGRIQGAAFLTNEQLERYRLTDFVINKKTS